MNALGFTEADGDRVRRRLEMNWFGIQDIGEKARIQLLSGSLDDGEAPLLVDILAEDYPGGYYTTDIELPTLSMEELGWVPARNLRIGVRRSSSKNDDQTMNVLFQLQPSVRLPLLDCDRRVGDGRAVDHAEMHAE